MPEKVSMRKKVMPGFRELTKVQATRYDNYNKFPHTKNCSTCSMYTNTFISKMTIRYNYYYYPYFTNKEGTEKSSNLPLDHPNLTETGHWPSTSYFWTSSLIWFHPLTGSGVGGGQVCDLLLALRSDNMLPGLISPTGWEEIFPLRFSNMNCEFHKLCTIHIHIARLMPSLTSDSVSVSQK